VKLAVAATAAVALCAGCITPTAPGDRPDLSHRAAAAGPAPSPSEPALPANAEVEISGTVTRPAGVKGDVTVWITDGPCWQPTTHAFNSTKTIPDKFFLEVFVKQGTQLWACAALGDPAKPLTTYGQAVESPMLGKGTGEVVFSHLHIALAKGKAVGAPPKI
jgi:hypothetical protein